MWWEFHFFVLVRNAIFAYFMHLHCRVKHCVIFFSFGFLQVVLWRTSGEGVKIGMITALLGELSASSNFHGMGTDVRITCYTKVLNTNIIIMMMSALTDHGQSWTVALPYEGGLSVNALLCCVFYFSHILRKNASILCCCNIFHLTITDDDRQTP